MTAKSSYFYCSILHLKFLPCLVKDIQNVVIVLAGTLEMSRTRFKIPFETHTPFNTAVACKCKL